MAFSQNYGYQYSNTWVFGESILMNFHEGEAVPELTPIEILIPNGCSSVSNSNGELLLYSDGTRVMGMQFDNIENGDNLKGNNFSSQSSIIIPQPGSNSRFYLFTVDMYIPPVFVDGVNYSVIEFTDEGEAVMVSKNNLLLTENAQKIAAVKHQNGKDYWIVVHGFGDEKGGNFYSFLLTESKLDTVPIVTTIGHPHNGNSNSNNGAGSMKISPDGSKLALVIPDDGIVEVYDFNTQTGQPFNLISSNLHQFNYVLGLEFSPDASKLYFTISPNGEGANNLYKVDLDEADPFSNPFLLHQFMVSPSGSADSLFGALQLAPDGKIYASKFRRGLISKENLGVIYNPNREREFCNYNNLNYKNNNGLFLNGGGCLIGLPNFVSSFLDIPAFYSVGHCINDTSRFVIRNTANIDSVTWNFGGDGELLETQAFTPAFIYSDPGIYQVELITYFNGKSYEYNYQNQIFGLLEVPIFSTDTMYFYENSVLTLDAGEWDTYLWQPGGSTERFLDVTDEGIYSVKVSDANCCSSPDSVKILFITDVAENKSIKESFRIYPNPASSIFFIAVANLTGSMNITVFDFSGKQVFCENGIEISSPNFVKQVDISTLPKGIYALKIENESGAFFSKIIIGE